MTANEPLELKHELTTGHHVSVLISAIEYKQHARMVEVLGPCWSQQWHVWMLALQPATLEQTPTAPDGCYCWIVVSTTLLVPLQFADMYSEVGKLSIRSAKQSSQCLSWKLWKVKQCKKYRCVTKLIVIKWRLEDDLDWSSTNQSFVVFKHSSGSDRDRTHPLGLLARPQTPS